MTNGTPSTPVHGNIPPASRRWDWIAALLMLAAIAIASGRLIATEWTDHLADIQPIAILAVIAGLALGRSIFSPRLSLVFAACYGLFAVVRQLGLLLEFRQAVLWQERLLVLGGRLLTALGQLLRREEVTDPLLFLFFMAALFWGLGVHAGYSLTRHTNPWRAILPTGLALLIIQLTDPYVASRGRYVPFYLFISLLLIARVTYLRNRIMWDEERAYVPSYIAGDLTYPVLVSAALLVILAWSAPALLKTMPGAREAWLTATRPLREWLEERGEEAFAALRRSAATVGISDRYGEELALGLGVPLGDAVVMTVQTPYHLVGVRYYWRARVYDYYANGQWGTSAYSVTQSLQPPAPALNIPELQLREGETFTFTAVVPFITLYAAPQPEWVSRQVMVDMALNPDGTVDVAALRADPPVYTGESYQAISALSNELTVLQLRNAGTDYPDWVEERYLQLPPEITPRTRELARIIAGDLDNPYDIAEAVTAYLRRAITYTETVPPPPPNRELLDWFLFDLREGFCNYYASAEVILLRSLGIPARLAVGYAEGEKERTSGVYLVRQRDAHAWPEVYFPGLGWVEFEPTSSRAPIYRPSGTGGPEVRFRVPGPTSYEEYLEKLEARLDRLREEEAAAPPTVARPQRIGLYWALLVVLGVGGGYLLTVAWRRQRERRNLPPVPLLLEMGLRKLGVQPPAPLRSWATYATASPLERAYWELNQALRRLQAPPAPSDTPAERAATLIRLLPAAAQAVHTVVTEYQAAVYGLRPGDVEKATLARREIRRLSWKSYLEGQLREKGDELLHPLRLLARRFQVL